MDQIWKIWANEIWKILFAKQRTFQYTYVIMKIFLIGRGSFYNWLLNSQGWTFFYSELTKSISNYQPMNVHTNHLLCTISLKTWGFMALHTFLYFVVLNNFWQFIILLWPCFDIHLYKPRHSLLQAESECNWWQASGAYSKSRSSTENEDF